jgi:hypothetical protein
MFFFSGVEHRATGLRHQLPAAFLHLLQASKVRHCLQGTCDLSGHRAVGRKHVCSPPFVLWLYLQVLETSPYRGGVVEICIWHYYDHLFQVPGAFLLQGSVAAAALVFSPARWGKFHFLYIWCPRSWNLVCRLPFERDTIWNLQNFAYLWMYLFRIVHIFWTVCGCVDGVSFYGLLRSEIEFRQRLPVVLRIHNLHNGTCIWRTAGRCCQNSVSDWSRP